MSSNKLIKINPKNIYELLQPMYLVSKVFGLTPFCIGKKPYKKSKLSLLISICIMLFLTSNITLGIIIKKSVREGFVSKVTATVDICLTLLGTLFEILFGCIFAKDILLAIHDIDAFDIANHTRLHIDLRKAYRRSSFFILSALCTTILCILLSLGSVVRVTEKFFTIEFIGEFVSYAVPIMINTFVNFQFCTLIQCVKQRLGWLNEKLLHVSKKYEHELKRSNAVLSRRLNKIRPFTHFTTTGLINDKAINILKHIRANHYTLCCLSQSINKAYSFQILLIIMQSFVTIIAGSLYTGRHILFAKKIFVEYLVYSGIQMGIAALQIIALVITCSSISREALKSASYIHNISFSRWNFGEGSFQSEIKLFSLQLLNHNIKFTACRMFDINETLLLSITGAVTTYLVIVTQFEMADSENHKI